MQSRPVLPVTGLALFPTTPLDTAPGLLLGALLAAFAAIMMHRAQAHFRAAVGGSGGRPPIKLSSGRPFGSLFL